MQTKRLLLGAANTKESRGNAKDKCKKGEVRAPKHSKVHA